MRKFKSYNSRYWHSLLARTGLIIGTVAIIVWVLPRKEELRFHYDMGKPWMYNSFIAKFDFPIYKTDEAIKAEQDSMLAVFQPYYNCDPTVERKQIGNFLKDFKSGIPGLSNDYLTVIVDRLHRLYQAGIMATPDYNHIIKDSTNMVRVVNGKQAQSVQINCIYSTMAAYERLFLDEKLAPQRQILQRCNLNDYLTPNLTYDKTRSEAERNDLLGSIPIASGMVMSGQKIIDRGDIVNDYTYRVLASFEREMKRRSATSEEVTMTLTGQTIFVSVMMILFTLYLSLFRQVTQHFDALRLDNDISRHRVFDDGA